MFTTGNTEAKLADLLKTRRFLSENTEKTA
jgi:hypothetical protein